MRSALEHRRARRRQRYVEADTTVHEDDDEDAAVVVSQRRQLGFLKYADPVPRIGAATQQREHAKQIAMALSSLSQQHPQDNDALFADFGSAFDDPTESSTTQSSSWWTNPAEPLQEHVATTTTKPLAWDATAVQQQQQRHPHSTPQSRTSTRTSTTTPPTHATPSQSAAARRRMRQTMRGKQTDDTSLYSDTLSLASGSLWPTEETAAQITPRSAQQAFFEPKESTASHGFAAFGWEAGDPKKSSSQQKTTSQQATGRPSAMLLPQQHDLIDGFADWGDSTTNSSVEEPDAAAETFVVHKPPVTAVVQESSKLPSERSSLTADDVSDHQRSSSGSVNMFKQQAGFHTQQKPRRKVVRPTMGGSIRTESTAATTAAPSISIARPRIPDQPTQKIHLRNSDKSPARNVRSAVERQQQRSPSSWNAFTAAETQSDHGAAWNAFPPSPRVAATTAAKSEGGAGRTAASSRTWKAFPSTSPRTAEPPWNAFVPAVSQPRVPVSDTTTTQPWKASAGHPSLRSDPRVPVSGTTTQQQPWKASAGHPTGASLRSDPRVPVSDTTTTQPWKASAGHPTGSSLRSDPRVPVFDTTTSTSTTQRWKASAGHPTGASLRSDRRTTAQPPPAATTTRSTNRIQPEPVEQTTAADLQQQQPSLQRQEEEAPTVTKEPKPLTYRERRELELKREQEEAASSPPQQQQTESTQDIRSQIKRRVAEAKQKQPEAAALHHPSKTEFSDIRNRLRPVGQRGDASHEKSQQSSSNRSQTSLLENRSSSLGSTNTTSPQALTADTRISPRIQRSPRESPRIASIRTEPPPAHQNTPSNPSPRKSTPRSNPENNVSSFSGQPPSPLESVRSSLQGRLSREIMEQQELPWERPRVEDSCVADLVMESSSSQEEQQQHRPQHQEPATSSVNKQAAAAAISQSTLMQQLQQRRQAPKQGPPKALSVTTSDATSVSEDRNRTPKATMMMLNAFLAGRDSVASSDGPGAATAAADESKQEEEVDPLEGRKSPTRQSHPSLKDDPKYEKFFKMMKVGMPMDMVKHSMIRDGLDPSVLDGDHDKPVGIPLKDDPTYAKYFRMLKVGMPKEAVKHSMERDGLDSAVLDQDHELPAATLKSQDTAPKEQDSLRRARLHWKTLRKVTSNSLWAKIEKDSGLNIKIDEEEFQELFQADRSAPSAPSVVQRGGPNKQKPSVCVIEAKRANNGGIILARLKMSHDDMADAVDRIDEHAMTTQQIENIIEYLPSKEEKRALESYMLGGGQDAAEKFDALCECEKFMVSMMTVKHAKRKVSAILFKLQFETCVRDIQKEACMIDKACNELHDSTRLRQLLGIVLTFGNRLNTAGNGKRKAGAFTLDSLLKLRQAKAFDKKTTFLHYIVSIVQRNNTDLLVFADDLGAVFEADKIYWDQCIADLEQVEHQLENVRKIALYQSHQSHGYRLRKKTRKDDPEESLTDDDEDLTLEEEVENLRATPIGMFTLSAIKYISQLREKVECTKAMFKKLLEYFGEEESAMQPHELYSIIVRFCKDFEDAKLEVIEKQERKQREELRRQSGDNRISPQKRTPAKKSHPPGMLLKASSHQPNMGSVLSELRSTPFTLRRTTSGGVDASPQIASPEPRSSTARSDVGPSPRSRGLDASPHSSSFRFTTPDKRQMTSPEGVSGQAVSRVVHHSASSTATSSSTSALRAKAKLRLNRASAEPSSPTRRSRGSIVCDDDVGAQQPVSPRQATPNAISTSQNTLSPRSSIRMKRRVQLRNRNRTGVQ